MAEHYWWVGPGLMILIALMNWAINQGQFGQALKANTEAIEKLDEEVTEHKRDIWRTVNDQGQRLSSVEATCNIRHGNGRTHHV